jgi:hypothetical protein
MLAGSDGKESGRVRQRRHSSTHTSSTPLSHSSLQTIRFHVNWIRLCFGEPDLTHSAMNSPNPPQQALAGRTSIESAYPDIRGLCKTLKSGCVCAKPELGGTGLDTLIRGSSATRCFSAGGSFVFTCCFPASERGPWQRLSAGLCSVPFISQ